MTHISIELFNVGENCDPRINKSEFTPISGIKNVIKFTQQFTSLLSVTMRKRSNDSGFLGHSHMYNWHGLFSPSGVYRC